MRLLLITFVLDEDHPTLAWQAYVARELAAKVEKLVVVTLNTGRITGTTPNMQVVVPPIRPMGLPHRLGGRWAFNKEVYELCRDNGIEAVFVHMAKEWAYQLYPAFKLLGLPVVLWYAHGTVTPGLRLALACVDRVVTSTPEGCRVANAKIRVIGQAIDTDGFAPRGASNGDEVLYVGRISRRKRIHLLYDVARAMKQRGADMTFNVVGPTRTAGDLKYDYELRGRVWNERMESRFNMMGFVPHARIPELYETTFLHINVSDTGSMDKSVMEALASGCPVLTSNVAFRDLLGGYREFIIDDERPEAIAEQVAHIHARRREYDASKLRELVLERHSLDTYADRVLREINALG